MSRLFRFTHLAVRVFFCLGLFFHSSMSHALAECTLQIHPIADMYVHKDFPVDCRATASYDASCLPITWSVTAGPPEFNLDGAGGLFYWMPAALGTETITIRVSEVTEDAPAYAEETFQAIVDDHTITYPLWRDYRTEETVIDVQGRAHGADFVCYSLSYAAVGAEDIWYPVTGPRTTPVEITGSLGLWDVSQLPNGGRYILKLSVELAGGAVSELRNQVILDRTLKPGWSKRIGPISHAVMAADLDDDDQEEIIAVTHFGELYVWKIDGTLLFRVGPSQHQATYSGPAVGDIDGDGAPEILWASVYALYAYRANGSMVVGFPLPAETGKEFRTAPTLADLDGDGELDILIVDRVDSFDIPEPWGKVHVFRYDSISQSLSALSGWPESIQSDISPYASASVGDLDGDGRLEVVAEGYDRAYAWHADGSPVAGWTGGVILASPITGTIVNGSGSARSSSKPAIADLNRDDVPEIIVGSNVLSADGTRPPGWINPKPGATNSLSPAIGDIDLNPANGLEVVLGKKAWYASGAEVEGFPLPVPMSSAVMVDCGGVDHLDVLGGTRLSSTPGLLGFHAGHHAEVIEGYPKSLYGEAGDVGSPIVGDFDGDGWTDVAFAITDASYGGIVAIYDMPFLVQEERHHWPMLGHDIQQTGYYLPPRPNRPRDLVASMGDEGIWLGWSDLSGAEDGFLVERSETGTPWSYEVIADDLEAGSGSFTDLSIVSAGTYHYRVRAFRVDPVSNTRVLSKASNVSSLFVNPVIWNDAPVFVGVPAVVNSREGQVLSFGLAATDSEDDDVLISVHPNSLPLPSGAVFISRPETDLFRFVWNVPRDQTDHGEVYLFTFIADDGNGGITEHTVTVNIEFVNQPPLFSHTKPSPVTGCVGRALSFRIFFNDPDRDSFTVIMTTGPQGSSFNPSTSTFTWTPAQAGTYFPQFTARDEYGAEQAIPVPIRITVTATCPSGGGPTPQPIPGPVEVV